MSAGWVNHKSIFGPPTRNPFYTTSITSDAFGTWGCRKIQFEEMSLVSRLFVPGVIYTETSSFTCNVRLLRHFLGGALSRPRRRRRTLFFFDNSLRLSGFNGISLETCDCTISPLPGTSYGCWFLTYFFNFYTRRFDRTLRSAGRGRGITRNRHENKKLYPVQKRYFIYHI